MLGFFFGLVEGEIDRYIVEVYQCYCGMGGQGGGFQLGSQRIKKTWMSARQPKIKCKPK